MISKTNEGKNLGDVVKMIKVKAYANYGFSGCDMEFEEEFPDDVTNKEIEETMKDLVYQQVDWHYEKSEI